MRDAFYKVSMIRHDGGVGETTFLGYAAESCALQHAAALEGSEYVRHVVVVQRHVAAGQQGKPDAVTWDVIREYKSERI